VPKRTIQCSLLTTVGKLQSGESLFEISNKENPMSLYFVAGNTVALAEVKVGSFDSVPFQPEAVVDKHYRFVTVSDNSQHKSDDLNPKEDRPVLVSLTPTPGGFQCPTDEVVKVLRQFVMSQHESITEVEVVLTLPEDETWKMFKNLFPNFYASFIARYKQNNKLSYSFFSFVDAVDRITDHNWYVVKSAGNG
jgi:hypothetical protein